ncbi:MAG TPA: zf-HC2 domain-containing protein [Candidatus Binatia bacterium]
MAPAGNIPDLSCTDFEQLFDRYVDDLLSGDQALAASRHIFNCRACDREVTRWQQTRILLSTAVSDLVTAVDVSGLAADVHAALGMPPAAAAPHRHVADRDASFEREGARRGAAHDAADRRRSRPRRGLSAIVRLASVAGVSAMAAAAVVMLFVPMPKSLRGTGTAGTTGTTGTTGWIASAPATVRTASAHNSTSFYRASRAALRNIVAPVAYIPPPLAHPQSAHVDDLEAAPGRQVSTWVQPRTNARVIWVEAREQGTPIRLAGLER